jgi:hypothetical protein
MEYIFIMTDVGLFCYEVSSCLFTSINRIMQLLIPHAPLICQRQHSCQHAAEFFFTVYAVFSEDEMRWMYITYTFRL